MSDSNRRGFLIAGAATVAGAAAVAATRPGAAADPTPTADELEAASAHGEILAHVHDVRAGTISLMVEGHQVSVTDPTLAARIAKAMHSTTV